MHIRYNLEQVLKAAQFIWDNNPSCPHWPDQPQSAQDVVEHILRHAERQAQKNANNPDRWTTFSGTGGYMILFTSDDDLDNVETVDVDVYVDPAVGTGYRRWVDQFVEE